MKTSESVNWAQLRRDAGLTLGQASERSGYGAATINGLEKKGDGSKRLKWALAEVYGLNPDYVLNPEIYQAPILKAKEAASKVKDKKEAQSVFDATEAREREKLLARVAGVEAAEGALRDEPIQYGGIDWRGRALVAEKKLANLRIKIGEMLNEL